MVSQDAIIPVSKKHDTAGTLARTVRDSAALLTVIAGKDPNDPRTGQIPFDKMPDYTKSCEGTDLSSMRIGVPWNVMVDVPEVIRKSFDNAVALLKGAGATVFDTDFPAGEEYRRLETREKLTSMLTGFHVDMDHFLENLAENPNRIRSVEDLCAYTKQDSREDYPARDIELWEWALEIDPHQTESRIANERDSFYAGDGGILGALNRSSLDALIFPTAAKTPDNFAAGGGLPVITVPLGYLPNATDTKWNERHDLVIQAPNRP